MDFGTRKGEVTLASGARYPFIARSARWMWAASYLIHRNGMLLSDSLQKQGFWLQLEGLVFQSLEHGPYWVRDAGEEIVLVVRK